MLEYMRKNANSSVVWFIIGAIALVFVFFGISGGGGGYQKISVNGEEVSPYDFENTYNALARQQSGDISQEQRGDLRKMTARILISDLLARQFGENVGLTPSDEAVARRIVAMPDFQTDGRFDAAKYDAAFANRSGRKGKEAFEADIRRQMLMERVSGLFTGLAGAYEPELLERFGFQEDKNAFDYAFFPAEKHRAGLIPGDEALTVYYALNQERWRTPAEMKIEYVEIKPADFIDKVQVSDEELKTAYDEYPDRFRVNESAEVGHILIRFPTLNPTAEEKAAALEKAKAAYERAKTEDFAALAKELSEDPGSAADGGALGDITRGLTLPAFEEAVFAATVGQVTEPVETEVGYHLVKVTKRQEEGIRSFEDVRGELEAEHKNVKARDAAVAEMENLLTRVETNPKLSAAAESMNLEVKTSDIFTAQTAPAFFEANEEEIAQAFKASVGRVAPAIEKDQLLVVYSPVERKESAIPPLDDVRAEVVAAWVDDKSAALARKEAEEFIAQANKDGWDEALATRLKDVASGRSSLDSRRALLNSDSALAGSDPMLFMAAASSMGQVGHIAPLAVAADNPAYGGRGALALRLAEIKPMGPDDFDGMVKQTFGYIISVNKTKMLFEVWDQALYQASDSGIKVPAALVN